MSIFLYYYSKKRKIYEKNKRCLLLLNKPLNEEEKNKLKTLVKENFRFFYFLENNNLTKNICGFLKNLSAEIKCYFAHNDFLFWQNDVFYYLEITKKNDKLFWAYKDIDLLISDEKDLPSFVKNNKTIYF